jgi:hypothetical protein
MIAPWLGHMSSNLTDDTRCHLRLTQVQELQVMKVTGMQRLNQAGNGYC